MENIRNRRIYNGEGADRVIDVPTFAPTLARALTINYRDSIRNWLRTIDYSGTNAATVNTGYSAIIYQRLVLVPLFWFTDPRAIARERKVSSPSFGRRIVPQGVQKGGSFAFAVEKSRPSNTRRLSPRRGEFERSARRKAACKRGGRENETYRNKFNCKNNYRRLSAYKVGYRTVGTRDRYQLPS